MTIFGLETKQIMPEMDQDGNRRVNQLGATIRVASRASTTTPPNATQNVGTDTTTQQTLMMTIPSNVSNASSATGQVEMAGNHGQLPAQPRVNTPNYVDAVEVAMGANNDDDNLQAYSSLGGPNEGEGEGKEGQHGNQTASAAKSISVYE